jgi:hypothetical protein
MNHEQQTLTNRMIEEAIEYFKSRVQFLHDSGGIDMNGMESPKALVCAALYDTAAQAMPFSNEGKASVKNLRHV